MMTAPATPQNNEELAPAELCAATQTALEAFIDIMNRETILLRAGKLEEAGQLSADKARLAQDYVLYARRVQHNAAAIAAEAPDAVKALKRGQEALAAEMAANLKMLASARSITEQLISDVAGRMGQSAQVGSYGNTGKAPAASTSQVKGISVNRAL
ncbi:hypothetical protein [Cucumibacter marinus]|uniref:hypothetical protein n=1 Tax=Cucumibacter marinus TaxID=1121252 RepID=UPI000409EA40|nr:hypothetical protein [Cucumibacter marinus]